MSAASTHPTTRARAAGHEQTHNTGSIRNKILGLLPPSEREAILARAELVTVQSREMIFEPDEPIRFVHFPENCVISLVTQLQDGDQVEAMTTGNDGFVGLAIFHGLASSRLKAFGQISGQSYRITVKEYGELAAACPDLYRLMHRYSQFVFETVAQSAACNRLHVIEQRCARWLLMSEDRVGRDTFDLTQEFLAEMLGVRRPGVTVAMGILEKAGLITHRRGSITVVNRAGLEKASCECYGTIRDRQTKLIK